MYTKMPKKSMMICILDILRRYSDEEHRLSQQDIIKLLESEYDMKVDRKAVRSNLGRLLEYGCELEYTEKTRQTPRVDKQTGERHMVEDCILTDWYLHREFEDSELRLLIDSLLFSKHIPYSQCKELIAKLEGLSSVYFQARVKHIRSMPDNAPANKQLFYTIDVLDSAIEAGKKVAFNYCDYRIDKRMHPRLTSSGEKHRYIVSPYQMAAANGRYYLVCNHDNHDNLSNIRLDRITDIVMLEQPVREPQTIEGMTRGFDLPKHMAEHIYMFSGDSVRARLRVPLTLISDVIDWLGGEVRFSEPEGNKVCFTVTVNKKALFFWCMQYGMDVELLEPAGMRAELLDAARLMTARYESPTETVKAGTENE